MSRRLYRFVEKNNEQDLCLGEATRHQQSNSLLLHCVTNGDNG